MFRFFFKLIPKFVSFSRNSTYLDLPLAFVVVKIIIEQQHSFRAVQGSGGGMATNPQLPQEHDGYYPAEG